MEENKTHMAEAINLALNNVDKNDGGPFGAVVVKDGKIIGRGSNQVTSKNDPTAHAEILAIRDACETIGTFDLEGTELYASCEPCPMCLGAVYWAKIGKLFYAATKDDAANADFNDAFIYKEFELPKTERSIPTIQLLRDDAVKVFEKWNASTKKIPY